MKNFLITFLAALLGVGVAALIYERYKAHEKQKEEEAAEQFRQQYLDVANVAAGLSSLAQLRPHIEVFWHETGELPCQATDLHLPTELLALQTPVLRDISLTNCGELTATYTEESGTNGGTLVLRARVVETSSDRGLVWDCLTPDYLEIEKYLPTCRYEPPSEEPQPSGREPTGSLESETLPMAAVTSPAPGTFASAPSPANCREGEVIHKSVFTDSVTARVPVVRFVALGPRDKKVLFFTEIVGARGREVTHRWFLDDEQIAEVPFSVEGDRWRTWSSKQLLTVAPGVLRVEVLDGSCLIGQESIQIKTESQVDPATRSGWMRPISLLETSIAQGAQSDPEIETDRYPVDGRDEAGDPFLVGAIRRGEIPKALMLIEAQEVLHPEGLTEIEQWQFYEAADPFLRGTDGVSPLDLAHRLGQEEVVSALLDSALLKKGHRDGPGWEDSRVRAATADDATRRRFSDGETGLMRAARVGNERAVLTLLKLGTEATESDQKELREMLFAYDASGRQPLSIARDHGFYGTERLIEVALERASPPWSLIRSSVTTGMEGEEPINCRGTAFTDENELYYFTELADLDGKTVHHEWRFDGDVVQTNSLEVRSDHWKTFSKRRFSEKDAGRWEVRTVDAQGINLGSTTFAYKAVSEGVQERRDAYHDPRKCHAGSSPLFTLVRAHAPVSRIQNLLSHTDLLPLRPKEHRKLFLSVLESGSISLTRWFLDSGFDVNASVLHDRTPLMIAAEGGDEPMALFLISMGAKLDVAERLKKRTALIHAVTEGHLGLTRILLDHGAAPNIQDDDGFTALHKAVTRGCNPELTTLLLEHGADPSMENKQGKAPKDYTGICSENVIAARLRREPGEALR